MVRVVTERRASRPPLVVAWGQLCLSLAVLGIGLFITAFGLRNPTGPHLRRLGAGAAAVVLGLVGTWLSVGRACVACRRLLRRYDLRVSPSAAAALALALQGADVAAMARMLVAAIDGRTEGGASSLLAYCDACQGTVALTLHDGHGEKRRLMLEGEVARNVVPLLAAAVARGEASVGGAGTGTGTGTGMKV